MGNGGRGEGKERKVRRRGKDRRGGLERREEWEIDGRRGMVGRGEYSIRYSIMYNSICMYNIIYNNSNTIRQTPARMSNAQT